MKLLLILSFLLLCVVVTSSAQTNRFKTANAKYWVDTPNGQLDFIDRVGRIARIELEQQIDPTYDPEITIVYDEKLKKPYQYRISEDMIEGSQIPDNRNVFKFKCSEIRKDKRVVFDE